MKKSDFFEKIMIFINPDFHTIKSLPVDTKLSYKYKTQLCAVKNEFDIRFADFRTLDNDFV